jgi:hypothetical protein
VLLSSYMTDNGSFDHNLLTNCFSNRENAEERQRLSASSSLRDCYICVYIHINLFGMVFWFDLGKLGDIFVI